LVSVEEKIKAVELYLEQLDPNSVVRDDEHSKLEDLVHFRDQLNLEWIDKFTL
jgi:hypothetical protein